MAVDTISAAEREIACRSWAARYFRSLRSLAERMRLRNQTNGWVGIGMAK